MLCLRAPWLKCFAQRSSGCFDPEPCPHPCPASSTAQHWGSSPGSRGSPSTDLQQQQPGEDQQVSTSLKVELKAAFDWSVSCVKLLLAYNLSNSRNMILRYPTTCRVMDTVILHSSSGEHFQACRLWSVLGLCRCFKMSPNVTVSVSEHGFLFGPGMRWAASWKLLKKGPNARSKIVMEHKDQWIEELLQISNWG